MLVTVASDILFFPILWKSMASINCLQQKTETHTGLEQLNDDSFHFWVNYPFKS